MVLPVPTALLSLLVTTMVTIDGTQVPGVTAAITLSGDFPRDIQDVDFDIRYMDTAGNTDSQRTVASATTDGSSINIDVRPPAITEATVIEPTVIELTSGEPVLFNSAQGGNVYSVSVSGTAFTVSSVTAPMDVTSGQSTTTLFLNLASSIESDASDIILTYNTAGISGAIPLTDRAGNSVPNGDQTNVINGDEDQPTFTASRTNENTIVVTFSKAVNATDTTGQGWTVSGENVLSSTTVNVARTLELTTSTNYDTGITPTVRYDGSGDLGFFFDGTAIPVRSTPRVTAIDNVTPTIVQGEVQSSRTIDILFSERIVYHDNLQGSDFAITNPDVSSSDIEIVSNRNNSQTNVLTLRVPATINFDPTIPTVAYTADASRPIADPRGNFVANTSGISAANNDNTQLALNSAAVVGNETIQVQFNKDLRFTTVRYTDFAVSDPRATILDATINESIVTLTLVQGSLTLSDTPTVRLTGSVSDTVSNTIRGIRVVAQDASPPTFTADRRIVSDGAAAQFTITFNQGVRSPSSALSQWTIPGHTITLFTHSGDSNRVILRTTGDTTTDATPTVTYNQPSDATLSIQNAAGIAVADGTSATARDTAVPIITVTNVTSDGDVSHTSARVGDTITITILASEPIEKPALSFFEIPDGGGFNTLRVPESRVTSTDNRTWIGTFVVDANTPNVLLGNDESSRGFPTSVNIRTMDFAGNIFSNGRPSTGSIVDIRTEGPEIAINTDTSRNNFFTHSNNPNTNAFAKTGDSVRAQVTFVSGIMMPNVSDLLFNGTVPFANFGNNFTLNTFNTNLVIHHTITDDYPEGPIQLNFTISDPAGNTRVFTQDDLGLGNVIVDHTPPAYLEDSAIIFNPHSFLFSFTEPVTTGSGFYVHNILPDSLSTIGSNPAALTYGNDITTTLVTLDLSASGLPKQDDNYFRFNLTGVTDLVGNAAVNTQYNLSTTASFTTGLTESDVMNLDYNDTDDTVMIPIGASTQIRSVDVPDNIMTVIFNLTGFDDADALAGPSRNFTLSTVLAEVTLQTNSIATSGTHITGIVDGLFQISPSAKSPNNDSTGNAAFVAAFGNTHNLAGATVIEIGDPNNDLTVEARHAKITIPGLTTGFVFTIDAANSTKRILPCPEPSDTFEVYDGGNINATHLAMYFDDLVSHGRGEAGSDFVPPLLFDASTTDTAACHIGQVIYTDHFTGFGSASSRGGSGGGGGCEECTAPTLGYNSRGQKLVSGGFSYNGNPTDVQYFFTPYPLITTEVGVENVATFKIYDNQGPSYIMHFSMAFGLRTGDVISQSKAMIEYDIDFQGNGTITITDPENAIENDTVRILTDTVACTPEASYDCLEITIYHTFRAPLDFDIVASDVWDRKRNAWQNYYNHGIHVTGESLNPVPGVLVNNGTLRLYPLISDSTHVTVMMDATNNLYKLAPDGAYHVLSNTYELFHDIDESMYIVNGTPQQGFGRNHDQFEDNLFEQVELARAVLLHEILLGQPIENNDFFNMNNSESISYDQTSTSRQDDAQLQESLEYEQSKAESMLEYYFHLRDDGD